MTSRVCPSCRQEVDSEEAFCPRDGTRLITRSVYEMISKETDPLVGKRVANRYLVIRKLGEGGMGQVYVAEHEEIEKRLALKVLKREFSERGDVVQRFRQEAISASRIKHPNVIDIFDFGQIDDGRFYLAMELLEGRDLAELLSTDRVVEPQRAVRIALQICRALAAAHAKGVIHRDMKPENVFLVKTPDGEEIVKIVDFGIAQLRNITNPGISTSGRRKLTAEGMVFGTPEYMAPEQAAGRAIDPAVDVYATGVILFEMFAGGVPFFGQTLLEVLTAQISQPVPAIRSLNPQLRISPELERVIYKALEKQPNQRHQSMVSFAEALMATPEAALEVPIPLTRPAEAAGASVPGVVITPSASRPSGLNRQSADEVATATTQLAAGGTAAPRPRSGAVWWIVGLLAIGVVATGGVVLFKSALLGRDQGGRLASGPISAPSVTTSVAPSPAGSTSSTPVVVVTAPETITIHVETNPSGAVLKKREGESLLQVCSSTPCDYPAKQDEKLEFVAEKGSLRGTSGVLARAPQTVVIDLRGKSGGTSKGGNPTGNCEFCIPKGDPDCLKVIRPCNSPP